MLLKNKFQLFYFVAFLAFPTHLFADEFLDALSTAQAEARAQEEYFSAQFELNLSEIQSHGKLAIEELLELRRESLNESPKGTDDFKLRRRVLRGTMAFNGAFENQQTQLFWQLVRNCLKTFTEEYQALLNATPHLSEQWKRISVQGVLKKLLIQVNRGTLISFNTFKEWVKEDFENKTPAFDRVKGFVANIVTEILKSPHLHPHLSDIPLSVASDLKSISGNQDLPHSFVDYSSSLNFYHFLSKYLNPSTEIPQQFEPLVPTDLTKWVDVLYLAIFSKEKLSLSLINHRSETLSAQDAKKLVQSLLLPFTNYVRGNIQDDIQEIFRKKEKNGKKNAKKKKQKQKKTLSEKSEPGEKIPAGFTLQPNFERTREGEDKGVFTTQPTQASLSTVLHPPEFQATPETHTKSKSLEKSGYNLELSLEPSAEEEEDELQSEPLPPPESSGESKGDSGSDYSASDDEIEAELMNYLDWVAQERDYSLRAETRASSTSSTSSSSTSSSSSETPQIHLTGTSANVFRTIMGGDLGRASRFKHRHLKEFLRKIGGGIVKTIPNSDPRIAVPDFSDSKNKSITGRFHFVHNGRLTYPISRLQTYLKPLLIAAGLDRVIKVEKER